MKEMTRDLRKSLRETAEESRRVLDNSLATLEKKAVPSF